MRTITYSTNISCECCVKTVGFYLNNEETITNWDVDITHLDKVLTISGKYLNVEKIEDLIQKAGFTFNQR